MTDDNFQDGGHILIVDDTQKNIQVLGTLLRDEGYIINVATSGAQALELVPKVLPDLILLDIIMPDMDGFETCRRLKQDSATSSIPVIFLTAKVETEDIVRGFELGAVDYVTKPFNSIELLKRVETHLTVGRLQNRLENKVAELSGALRNVHRLQREQEAFVRHELSNAMGPVVGYIELTMSEAGDCLSDKEKAWLEKARSSAVSMNKMLRSLKRLHEFEGKDFSLDKREIQLEEMLAEAIRSLKVGAAERNAIDLVVQQQVVVCGDGSLLPGVFTNLIKNAVEHVVPLDDENEQQVLVTLDEENGQAVVTVQNGGEPIPEDRLATFFDKFNSTKSGQGGTGLGTTFAYLVTRAHGGRISVESSSDEGTTVTVRLPQAE